MLTIKQIALSAVLALAVASPAQALNAGTPGISYGIGAGTDGFGVDVAVPVFEWLDVRAGYDFGTYSHQRKEADIDYNAKLKFSSGRLLADFKPFAGGFRVSAGLYTGTPDISLKASGQDSYDIGDRTYIGDLDLNGSVDLGGAAPYFGLGWGGTAGPTGFGMSFDIGVLFAKSPAATLDAAGTACDATLLGTCDPNGPEGFDVNDPNDPRARAFQASKDQETSELEEDIRDFDLWPILRIALHYRF